MPATLLLLPDAQRVYDFRGGEGADAEPIQVVSQDNQPVSIPGTIQFSLATNNCDVLKAFHDNIGRRYSAYMVDGPDGRRTDTGWIKMMDVYLGAAANSTMDRVAKQYTWQQLYGDPAIKDEINSAVNEEIARLVNQQTDGDEVFFIEFSALLQQPLPDPELIQSLKDIETGKAAAEAVETRAIADAAAAEAAAGAQVGAEAGRAPGRRDRRGHQGLGDRAVRLGRELQQLARHPGRAQPLPAELRRQHDRGRPVRGLTTLVTLLGVANGVWALTLNYRRWKHPEREERGGGRLRLTVTWVFLGLLALCPRRARPRRRRVAGAHERLGRTGGRGRPPAAGAVGLPTVLPPAREPRTDRTGEPGPTGTSGSGAGEPVSCCCVLARPPGPSLSWRPASCSPGSLPSRPRRRPRGPRPDRPPSRPAEVAFASPAAPCASGEDRPVLRSGSPTLSAVLRDRDGDPVAAAVEVIDLLPPAEGSVVFSSVGAPQASGTTQVLALDGLVDGGVYRVRVRGVDAAGRSGPAVSCELEADLAAPPALVWSFDEPSGTVAASRAADGSDPLS